MHVGTGIVYQAIGEGRTDREVYSAGGGRVARVFTSETTGIWSATLTPEEVRDRFAEIRDERGAVQPQNSMDEMMLYRKLIP